MHARSSMIHNRHAMKLVSACLMGMPCAWHGGHYRSEKLIELSCREVLVPVCPERLGGLPIPRPSQEIEGGAGEDLLLGGSRVANTEGQDVTAALLKGAKETLDIAEALNVREFVGKSRSPSCGVGEVYDGSFTGRLVAGDGVTSALLRRHGIKVLSEDDV